MVSTKKNKNIAEGALCNAKFLWKNPFQFRQYQIARDELMLCENMAQNIGA